jgi:uncharacterized protein (TIGR00251 family)
VAQLDVRLIPRARKTGVAGTRDGAVLIRVAAPPVAGAANEALIDFLADRLKLPRRSIRIIGGETSRRKRVAVDGITADALRTALAGD